MSIPLTLVIYKFVFGIQYISFMHTLSVLIIIGIGADDCFVFHDNWKSSSDIKYLN